MEMTEIEISTFNSDYTRCVHLIRFFRYFETLAITFGAREYIFNNDWNEKISNATLRPATPYIIHYDMKSVEKYQNGVTVKSNCD